MPDVVTVEYRYGNRIIKQRRITVLCAYCGARLLRSVTRSKRNCFCNSAHMLHYNYEKAIFNPAEILKGAHEKMAELNWRRGAKSPNVAGDNNPAKRSEVRAKISAAKLERNWMRGRTGKLHHLWQGGKIWWRGKEWDQRRHEAKARDGFACVKCGRTEEEQLALVGIPLSVDHIIMYRISHDNSLDNLQTLCSTCHGKKIPEENILLEQVREVLAA